MKTWIAAIGFAIVYFSVICSGVHFGAYRMARECEHLHYCGPNVVFPGDIAPV